jgi:hypothetical protein
MLWQIAEGRHLLRRRAAAAAPRPTASVVQTVQTDRR